MTLPYPPPEFHYPRRVQFAETDLAGIVHFSWAFRYMEEAEHGLWRAAGLSIAPRGSDIVWPRVAACFSFRDPLRFEDQFIVGVRLADVRTRALQYEHTVTRGTTLIGTGHITSVCVRPTADGSLRSARIPDEIVDNLRRALAASAATGSAGPAECRLGDGAKER